MVLCDAVVENEFIFFIFIYVISISCDDFFSPEAEMVPPRYAYRIFSYHDFMWFNEKVFLVSSFSGLFGVLFYLIIFGFIWVGVVT